MNAVEAIAFIEALTRTGYVEVSRNGGTFQVEQLNRSGYGNTLIEAVESLDANLKATVVERVYRKITS